MPFARDSAQPVVRPRRRSLTNLGAFVFGVPAGIGILTLLLSLPEGATARRYVHHPVERVEVVLFCCALGALLGKVIGQYRERRALKSPLLPSWDGNPVPATQAESLLGELGKYSGPSLLSRRVTAVLEFVRSRGSANELDDHLRALADADLAALEGSYAFIRLIIWAIPILGFLGTVLGITGAISGVTPEVLEKSLSTVTDGLALAFDTTALALGLTMILMFANSMVDRVEQGTLSAVDGYVDEHLAHRFERSGNGDVGDFAPMLRQQSEQLSKTVEQLVERQAAIWARSMEKTERLLAETGSRQQERLCTALESALERTLAQHHKRLVELTAHVEVLSKLQVGEAQLVRLQEKLQQNLAALAGSGAFEQAVQSLTAAIHLLTARTGAGRFDNWSNKAA